MWEFNYTNPPDFLCHKDRKNHKYLDKFFKNGRWNYIYDKKSMENTANNGLSKLVDATNKGYDKVTNQYNRVMKENMYSVNSDNYDRKIDDIKKSEEWKQIVDRKDPEYVKKKEDGSYEYKIDDYLVKKKHPVLDILDDAMNGRKLDTNKVSLDTALAGAEDYVNAGLAYIGIRAKILTEAMKFRQGSYKQYEDEINTTIDNAVKTINATANASSNVDKINEYAKVISSSPEVKNAVSLITSETKAGKEISPEAKSAAVKALNEIASNANISKEQKAELESLFKDVAGSQISKNSSNRDDLAERAARTAREVQYAKNVRKNMPQKDVEASRQAQLQAERNAKKQMAEGAKRLEEHNNLAKKRKAKKINVENQNQHRRNQTVKKEGRYNRDLHTEPKYLTEEQKKRREAYYETR